MKFRGHGIVWDATNNRILCKFVNGEIETDDKNVINTLVQGGYEYEGELEVETEVDIEDDADEVEEENEVVVNENAVVDEEIKEESKKKSSKTKGAE